MTVLCLIPARSGSKSLPHKNIRDMAGKPLLAWSIEQALAAERVDRVIVSTDSEEYASLAREYGAEVPFIRPSELAGDASTDWEVFNHALNWLAEHEDYHPEICLHLRPTCPVRRTGMIDEILTLLQDHPEYDSVRTVTAAPHTPYKMWLRDEQGMLKPVATCDCSEPWNRARQELPQAFLQTANIDAVRSRVILEEQSMTGLNIYGYVEASLHDIDTPAEFEQAERALRPPAPPIAADGKRTFCFDIDGVIATITESNDYSQAQPVQPVVDAINRLHRAGHRIVLFTARGTMTGIDWDAVTRDQMARWGVPFHELIFGKPAADFYVDDRMLDLAKLDDFVNNLTGEHRE